MTQWWELAIPVAGTLAGGGMTAAYQAFFGTKQRHHDREMRFHDEKKAAYVRYTTLIYELKQSVEPVLAAAPMIREAIQGNELLVGRFESFFTEYGADHVAPAKRDNADPAAHLDALDARLDAGTRLAQELAQVYSVL